MSSDMLSGIPQELKDLFSWNLPLLVSHLFPGNKTTTKTCQPAFFNKHFTDEFKLLYVKHLPSLAGAIHQEKPKLLICRNKFGSALVSREQANFD